MGASRNQKPRGQRLRELQADERFYMQKRDIYNTKVQKIKEEKHQIEQQMGYKPSN